MTIEELVVYMTTLGVKCNRWDTTVVTSFYDQIHRRSGFTEKQAALALKLVTRYSGQLTTLLGQDIQQYIDHPQYKYVIRTVNTARAMSIVDYPPCGRAIKVIFPYKPEVVETFRKYRTAHADLAQWDDEQKAWMFSLSEDNLMFLQELAEQEGFELDAEIQEYISQIARVMQDFEQHVPTLVIENNVPKFRNVSVMVPELQSTSVLAAAFEARRAGIYAWDELVNYQLDGVHPITWQFLITDPGEPFYIDSEVTPMSSLTDIVKHLSPCLFVIPGSNELETTQHAYDFLKQAGFADEEISVMFRLPSDRHQQFNEFVRTRNLNSPITDATKIIFISCKLPKTVVKSNMKFNCIINLGFESAHYTTKAFIRNHENLVNFSKKPAQMEINWPQHG